jgi:hypothetical protein
MEEKNSPGDEDARITVPWLALSVMLSGFFSPLPVRFHQNVTNSRLNVCIENCIWSCLLIVCSISGLLKTLLAGRSLISVSMPLP